MSSGWRPRPGCRGSRPSWCARSPRSPGPPAATACGSAPRRTTWPRGHYPGGRPGIRRSAADLDLNHRPPTLPGLTVTDTTGLRCDEGSPSPTRPRVRNLKQPPGSPTLHPAQHQAGRGQRTRRLSHCRLRSSANTSPRRGTGISKDATRRGAVVVRHLDNLVTASYCQHP